MIPVYSQMSNLSYNYGKESHTGVKAIGTKKSKTKELNHSTINLWKTII